MRSRTGALVLGIGLALGATACGEEPEAATTVISEGESFGDAIPAPVGAAVLHVHGSTLTPNDGDVVSLDLATLERLQIEEWTIFEPFVDEDLVFTGIPLDTLLTALGMPASTTQITMDALDDYRIIFSVSDLTDGTALLATREGGEAIPIDEGGPIRVVFSERSTPGKNPDKWIWSLIDLSFS